MRVWQLAGHSWWPWRDAVSMLCWAKSPKDPYDGMLPVCCGKVKKCVLVFRMAEKIDGAK